MQRPALVSVVRELAAVYGPATLPSLTPFEFVLLENASYLVDDDRRWKVFVRLRDEIGVTPAAILAADRDALALVIADGGMKPLMRADKVRECARIAAEIGVDFLDKRMLRRFPGIGEPAADRILLACANVPCIAPDSNALRVLTRLGYVAEGRNYGETYRLAVAAAPMKTARDAVAAHVLLRAHGQNVCKRSSPRCEVCVLRGGCDWYARI